MKVNAIEHHGKYGVRCDGEDISNRCFEADSDAGIAGCFKHDTSGRPYYDWEIGDVAREIRRGNIEIYPLGRSDND